MAQVDTLTFETTEEVFCNGVVVGVALTGHTLAEMKVEQTLTVSVGGVLDTAVRVEYEAGMRLTAPDSHIEGIKREDSPLYWHRKRVRPLLGKFLPVDKPFVTYGFWERGQYMEFTQELVTARVLPDLQIDGRTRLRAVGLPWRKFWGFFQRTGNPGMRKQLDGWRKKIVRNKKCYTDVY